MLVVERKSPTTSTSDCKDSAHENYIFFMKTEFIGSSENVVIAELKLHHTLIYTAVLGKHTKNIWGTNM